MSLLKLTEVRSFSIEIERRKCKNQTESKEMIFARPHNVLALSHQKLLAILNVAAKFSWFHAIKWLQTCRSKWTIWNVYRMQAVDSDTAPLQHTQTHPKWLIIVIFHTICTFHGVRQCNCFRLLFIVIICVTNNAAIFHCVASVRHFVELNENLINVDSFYLQN